jgi:hypothetical protein
VLADHVQNWVGRVLTIGALALGAAFIGLVVASLLVSSDGTADELESFARVTFLGALICVVGWIVHAQRVQVGDIYQAGYDVGVQEGRRRCLAENCSGVDSGKVMSLPRAAAERRVPRR